MNLVKRTALYVMTAATMAGCAASSTDNVKFDAKDTKYDIDPRTGVCYSATGVSKFAETKNSLSMTCVPCTEKVLQMVDQDHLKQAKKDSIVPVNFAGPR